MSTGYYLLDNPNPHAKGGFHGYRTRQATPRIVVLHTSESAFDLEGPDRGAEAVAGFQSRVERPSSYHAIVDRDTKVRCLPWEYTAFGARGANADGIHIAIAGEAAEWDDIPDWAVEQIMGQLVPLVAEALEWAGLPAIRLGDSAARSGGRGLGAHSQIDPDRRGDPGPHFPWGRLLDGIDGGNAMSWLTRKWPEYSHEAAEVLATEHTDPNEKVASLTMVRFIVIVHRFGQWIIREVVKALR